MKLRKKQRSWQILRFDIISHQIYRKLNTFKLLGHPS